MVYETHKEVKENKTKLDRILAENETINKILRLVFAEINGTKKPTLKN